MIQHLFILFVLAVSIPAYSQSMKMVVNSTSNIVGRYVRTNADTYTVGVQDIYDVPKSGNRVVTFRAKRGQGVIWCKHIGRVSVYNTSSTKGDIIGHLVYEDGYVPETYRCMGKKKGWYKVSIDGRVGFVCEKQVHWDGMDTF